MASCHPEQWKAECEAYLTAQGPYLNRVRRYREVRRCLQIMGFRPGDIVYDLGAGMCDFARYMYSEGEAFRYVPIDGSIDGTDLDNWLVPTNADWFVSIETMEHLYCPLELMTELAAQCGKGVVITTPNPRVTDVLALDSDHKTPISIEDFIKIGYLPEPVQIHYAQDTLLATYQR